MKMYALAFNHFYSHPFLCVKKSLDCVECGLWMAICNMDNYLKSERWVIDLQNHF